MDLFLIIVIVLFALAITDLIIGVSNDAVNFLNSAIGAKAARFKRLMILTTIGVILGAIFSGGMMEVARKGIFHPEHFYLNEIMFMFLAVMLTDIILLDTFNSLGLPTSTTVSIVFELLGAAVGMSVIKIYNNPDALSLAEYINTEKALAIIMGILLSVFIAFTVGAIIQYLSRMVFSFRLTKNIKHFGGIFGGLALTAITYFMLIKGVKNAPFMTDEIKLWIADHSIIIMGISFAFWTLISQILVSAFKVDILRVIVLIGTIALAMAFASNDLVNFIGVPVAGLDAFLNFSNSGAADPESFSMVSLSKPIETKTYLLLIAGIIMAVTLWFSKKARSVVKTSVDLSRQDEGEERFKTSPIARILVRGSVKFSEFTGKIISSKAKNKIKKQFENAPEKKYNSQKEKPAFDMLRAAVNLIVASILISIGTSLKLPLSTTYVTFMVAMGTSLADRAWGRESAVYRITGVLSVIGGWFMTAISAFTVSFIILMILNLGGFVAVAIMVVLAALFIYRTYKAHKAKEQKRKKVTELFEGEKGIKEYCHQNVKNNYKLMKEEYENVLNALINDDLKIIKKRIKQIREIDNNTKSIKDNLVGSIQKFHDQNFDKGVYYVEIVDHLREGTNSLKFIGEPSFMHLANKHKQLSKNQKNDMRKLVDRFSDLHGNVIQLIEENRIENLDSIEKQYQEYFEFINKLKTNQLDRIQKKKDPYKASVLIINILQESVLITESLMNTAKEYRKFVQV